jgi:integrase
MKSNFKRFLKWLKVNGGKFATMTPDELIAYQKAQTGDGRYEILDLLQNYIQTRKGTYFYKRTQMASVNSFFQHNRADLPKDINYKIKPTKEGVNGSLTPDEIRKVILSCNKVYSTIYLVMFQAGLGEEEFIYWNTHGLAKLKGDLELDPSIIRINLPGRKSNRNIRPYYTLLGGDGLKMLKEHMAGKKKSEPAIFLDQFGHPVAKLAVAQNWTRHTKKSGVNGGRGYTGKNLHEIRDTFRTLTQKSPCDKIIPEFVMGHVVDPLGYNKACNDEQWVTKEYRKALPWLNILSSNRPYGLISEDIIEEQEVKIQVQQGQIDKQQEQIDNLIENVAPYEETYADMMNTIHNLRAEVDVLREERVVEAKKTKQKNVLVGDENQTQAGG